MALTPARVAFAMVGSSYVSNSHNAINGPIAYVVLVSDVYAAEATIDQIRVPAIVNFNTDTHMQQE